MPSTAVRLVIDDPENFHLLTTDMKEMIVKGAIATVNVQAALTRKNAINNIKEDFTLRNNFTTSQIQFEQMPSSRFISLENIVSRVGVTDRAGYMARQETGGERVATGGGNVAIPTDKARGGNRGSPVLKKLYLSKIKTVQGGRYGDSRDAGTYRSKLVARAAVAARENIFMRMSNEIFSVKDFTKEANGGVSFKMDLIYNIKYDKTKTPENAWLQPASEKPAQDVENIFISQMKKLGM
jgi:hypothetical protein